MRLATIRTADGSAVCRRDGEEFVVLPFRSMTELLSEPDWAAAAAGHGPRVPVDDATLLASVEPRKTFCVGLNYKSHIAETGREAPAYPTLFGKFCDSLAAPYADIAIPSVSSEVDWEVELGVVIGSVTRAVSVADALHHVAGYTVVNDVSMRDWQSRTNQWLQGKTFEASTPVGPFVVTPDELDHARDLRITCHVGDELMQHGRTSDLLFTAADSVSYISMFTTLQPGDLIATGTPGGTGIGQRPKRFLKNGETLFSEIEGIGRLANRIV